MKRKIGDSGAVYEERLCWDERYEEQGNWYLYSFRSQGSKHAQILLAANPGRDGPGYVTTWSVEEFSIGRFEFRGEVSEWNRPHSTTRAMHRTRWLSGSGPLATASRAWRGSDLSTLVWLDEILAIAVFDLPKNRNCGRGIASDISE